MKVGRKKGTLKGMKTLCYLNCKQCGKRFGVFPSRIKRNKKYCSKKCWAKAREGLKFSEEHKVKTSIALKNYYKINKMTPKQIETIKQFKGENHSKWKGGKIIGGRYRQIWRPSHPYCDTKGYIPEHRLIMEKKLGRYLIKGELVHHLDGNKLNNKIDNLYLFKNKSKHMKYHGFLRRLVMDCIKERIIQLKLDLNKNKIKVRV